MVLGVTEDFTTDVQLDAQLMGAPSSGLYINSGVHPSITLENLLAFLPFKDIEFAPWSSTKAYADYSTSYNRKDIVEHGGRLYQSIKSGTNQNPKTDDSEYWLETNIESLRIKSFMHKVMQRVYTELHLTKRLISNQYLYENGEHLTALNGDFSSVVIEPKGSDYISFRINEISVQAKGVDPINIYLVSGGVLKDTISYTPKDGKLNWVEINYVHKGSHPLYVVIDSTEVYLDGGAYDPFKYDGFTVYSAIGVGADAATANYTESVVGKGIGLNVTAYLDAGEYIDNNISELGVFVRATLEYMAFMTFFHNANNRSNRAEAIQMRDDILMAEVKQLDGPDTAVKRFYKERDRGFKLIEKTFDTEITDGGDVDLEIEITTL